MAAKNDSENDWKESSLSSDLDKTTKMNEMFCRIVNKADVSIKSQQRSETDLTSEQKVQILKDIFEQNPRTFLSRFGKWISLEDLRCFCAASGSEMQYAVRILERSLKAKASGVCVKNRRFEALQRLEKNGSYFSEDEMQQRCPLLYEQYIGQYLTDEEKHELDENQMKDEVKMSSFIFQQIDRDWLREKEKEEREMEECGEEEEDDDEGCDGIDNPNIGHVMDSMGQSGDIDGQEKTDISQEDKMKLREEFLNIMRQRFLEGEDEEFDYATVDTNDEYDNLEILGQDEQDKYFDEEIPEMISKNVVCEGEEMLTDSEEEDYLSDKILEQCCASGGR